MPDGDLRIYNILLKAKMILPNYEGAKEYSISAEGLQALLTRTVDPKYPHKNITWTDDIRVELPIKLAKSGVAATTPTTLIDEFQLVVKTMGHRNALSSKKDGKWVLSLLLRSQSTLSSTTSRQSALPKL